MSKGYSTKFKGKLSKRVRNVYLEELEFINNVTKHVPAFQKTQEITADSGGGGTTATDDQPQVPRHELKARLAAKLEELRKSKESTSTDPDKKKKKKRKKKDKSAVKDKPKQFTSKPNPNLSSNNSNSILEKVKAEDTGSISSIASSNGQRTPLRKKPVVKSNGQVVYSKFDFISDDKYYNTKQYNNNKSKSGKPTDMLKKVEKHENKIAKLEATGKAVEATTLKQGKKWDAALKRAQGEKVRDDPTLLKKTIKKESKIKQAHRKKWDERKGNEERQKQKKQDKRMTNIQARKDEKKKRTLKLQRKRGRIA